jgi:predicted DCC family thiol-disulfide oxidoreductase YuxK
MNVLLFDGVCNLCNGTVQFILKRDTKKRFKFASLQSEKGQALLKEMGLPTENFDSVVYIRAGKVLQKSSAGLYILRDLGGIWAAFFPLIIFPRFIRDAVYNLLARNRYRWFGRQESCMMPTPELKERFL